MQLRNRANWCAGDHWRPNIDKSELKISSSVSPWQHSLAKSKDGKGAVSSFGIGVWMDEMPSPALGLTREEVVLRLPLAVYRAGLLTARTKFRLRFKAYRHPGGGDRLRRPCAAQLRGGAGLCQSCSPQRPNASAIRSQPEERRRCRGINLNRRAIYEGGALCRGLAASATVRRRQYPASLETIRVGSCHWINDDRVLHTMGRLIERNKRLC